MNSDSKSLNGIAFGTSAVPIRAYENAGFNP